MSLTHLPRKMPDICNDHPALDGLGTQEMAMPDLDDDWMSPQTHQGWTFDHAAYEKRQRETPYIIQREKVIICMWVGDGGPPTKWEEWSRHATAKERDAELMRLHKEHPTWHLRPRNCDHRGHVREPYGP